MPRSAVATRRLVGSVTMPQSPVKPASMSMSVPGSAHSSPAAKCSTREPRMSATRGARWWSTPSCTARPAFHVAGAAAVDVAVAHVRAEGVAPPLLGAVDRHRVHVAVQHEPRPVVPALEDDGDRVAVVEHLDRVHGRAGALRPRLHPGDHLRLEDPGVDAARPHEVLEDAHQEVLRERGGRAEGLALRGVEGCGGHGVVSFRGCHAGVNAGRRSGCGDVNGAPAARIAARSASVAAASTAPPDSATP